MDGLTNQQEERKIAVSKKLSLITMTTGIQLGIVCLVLFSLTTVVPAQSQGSDAPVRATLQALFKVLRDKDVNAFYRYLPGRQQQQVRREDLVQFVSQATPYVTFQRGQVGEVQLIGNFAVADTILFVNLRNPQKKPGDRQPELIDAKIVMQQYLLREGTEWKLATGDTQTRADFIASIPEFKQGFVLHTDRLYVLRESKWVEVKDIQVTGNR